MPRIPRDLSGRDLCQLLERFGYAVSHRSGSHVRLSSQRSGASPSITIPDHNPIKIGTLNSILSEIAVAQKFTKQQIVEQLFG